MKEVAYEEWGWVYGRVVSLCNIDFTKVAEFGISVSTRTLGAVAGAEEGININIMTNEMSKAPSKIIYIDHNLVTSVNNSEMIN